jgi:PAS domain S-box-containing protein
MKDDGGHGKSGRYEPQEELRSPIGSGSQQNDIFRVIVEATPNAIVLTSAQGHILLVNAGAEKLFGYGREELIGKSVEMLLPERFREPHPGYRDSYTHDPEARPMGEGRDLYALRKDGSEVPVEIGLNPIETADGPVILSAIIDITERKRRDDQLRASLKQVGDLETALDEHAIVAITDPQGRIAFVNDKFCAISKYSREELLGQDHRIINSGFHSTEFIRDLWTTITHGRVWHGEIKNRAKDGSYYWVDTTIVPFLNDQGKPRQYVAIRADITERKRIEEQLRASLQEVNDLKTALDEHAIVAMTDPRGRITYVNDKFCAISKYSREELLGQDHRIINSGFHSTEFIRDLWTTITHGRVWHGEIKNRAKDGSYYWVDTTIVPFLNDQGKPRQYVAIRADITERKKAEGEVMQLNAELERRVVSRTEELQIANKELEAFSYSVSHDLRAPLRSVDGFSQAVIEDFGPLLPDEGRRYLQTIRESAQRMGMLIDDLLSFSRLGRAPLNKQEVNSEKLVRRVLEDLRPQRADRDVDVRIGDLPVTFGDPALLKQVWINLLSNALKYTQKRITAVVEIGCDESQGGQIFFVRDNGTGFDMRYAAKLFGVFQRLHRQEDYEGTGVGLALVQRIIHRHGGRVWAQSSVDRGATFYFTLEPKNTE